jgi:ubiquinone/menaquinone biosynthesis C-methylase UbiE
LRQIFKEVYRVLKPTGVFALVGFSQADKRPILAYGVAIFVVV